MELIMFVALIFMLWLLVQLGVGIYHQGLRRGLWRWARGLPRLAEAGAGFAGELFSLGVRNACERARANPRRPVELQDRIGDRIGDRITERNAHAIKEMKSMDDYLMGWPYEPPETRRDAW